jgi:Bacterial regulatory protein, Fis family
MAELEKQTILSTIAQLNGDKLLAARILGIGKTTLYRKLKEYVAQDQPSPEPRRTGRHRPVGRAKLAGSLLPRPIRRQTNARSLHCARCASLRSG